MTKFLCRASWLSSLGWAVALLAAGSLLNRLLDVSQDVVFFPTSLLYRRLSFLMLGGDTFPLAVRASILSLHVAIWTAIIHAARSLWFTRRRE
jgi:hypothetical protein